MIFMNSQGYGLVGFRTTIQKNRIIYSSFAKTNTKY